VTGKSVTREQFTATYENILDGSKMWQELDAPEGKLYTWDDSSTYIHNPPFFAST
jgi:aconitate hydratase